MCGTESLAGMAPWHGALACTAVLAGACGPPKVSPTQPGVVDTPAARTVHELTTATTWFEVIEQHSKTLASTLEGCRSGACEESAFEDCAWSPGARAQDWVQTECEAYSGPDGYVHVRAIDVVCGDDGLTDLTVGFHRDGRAIFEELGALPGAQTSPDGEVVHLEVDESNAIYATEAGLDWRRTMPWRALAARLDRLEPEDDVERRSCSFGLRPTHGHVWGEDFVVWVSWADDEIATCIPLPSGGPAELIDTLAETWGAPERGPVELLGDPLPAFNFRGGWHLVDLRQQADLPPAPMLLFRGAGSPTVVSVGLECVESDFETGSAGR